MAMTAEKQQYLTADEILGAPDVEYSEIRSWNDRPLRIQSLTAGDLIEWSEANEGEAKRTAGLRLIIKSVVDGEGRVIFNEKHLPLLRAKSHRRTEDIVKEILRLNGMNIRTGAQVKND